MTVHTTGGTVKRAARIFLEDLRACVTKGILSQEITELVSVSFNDILIQLLSLSALLIGILKSIAFLCELIITKDPLRPSLIRYPEMI